MTSVCLSYEQQYRAEIKARRQRLFRPQNAVEERKAVEAPSIAKTPTKRSDEVSEFIQQRSDFYGVPCEEITGWVKSVDIVHARAIIMAETRNRFKITLECICAYFGGRNHSTVRTSIRRGEYLLSEEGKPEFWAERDRIASIREDWLTGTSFEQLKRKHHVSAELVNMLAKRYRWPVRIRVDDR